MSLEEALSEFVDETDEMLDRVNIQLTDFEKTGVEMATLHSIYRDIHTIKGSAQLFGLTQMGQVAHAMEAGLDPIREGEIQLSRGMVEALFQGLDILRLLNSDLRNDGNESNQDDKLLQFIPHIGEVTLTAANATVTTLKDPPSGATTAIGSNESSNEAVGDPIALAKEKYKQKLKNKKSVAPVAAAPVAAAPVASAQTSAPAEPEPVSKTPVQPKPTVGADVKTTVKKSEAAATKPGTGSKEKTKTGAPNESIRVQVDILDNLMNMVGELLLVRNQLVQYGDTSDQSDEFSKMAQRLSVITSELQSEVMKTRMQPIGNVLTKFHRVIRDMAKNLGKDISLVLKGTETELDKTLIEAVKDPLTHIVRNSADHGLELPDIREAAGKSRTGTITIDSYHEGGHVIVEIKDDGAGLSQERIGNKAVEKGLLDEATLASMSERDIHQLIFAPGFSTAETVSNISGRGVGMDVVKTKLEENGGVVDLQSTEGVGTVIRLKIPLTLAIVPALIVKAGNEGFAIPQVKLVELVRVEKNPDGTSPIEELHGKQVYRLRGKLLPLISLSDVLEIEKVEVQDTNGSNIVVLNADSGYFGLIVDTIEDSTDIVVKPLANFLKNIGIYSGATVLGDGSVTLTLDVVGLAARAKIFQDVTASSNDVVLTSNDAGRAFTDSAEYLMVNIGTEDSFSIPLCLVNRLEEFSRSDIQMSGSIRVINYRDSILPIIDVAESLGFSDKRKRNNNENVAIVVIEKSNRLFGLEVESILDVLNIDAEIDTEVRDRPGILGSTLNGSELIVILDVYELISGVLFEGKKVSGAQDSSPDSGASAGSSSGTKFNILLAEDNGFFRKQVEGILTEAGYHVVSVQDGKGALEELKRSEVKFDLAVSDIEMPVMTGLEFAKGARELAEFSDLPLIALTTKFRKKDQEKGFEAGFNYYLEKLDQDELIKTIHMLLADKEGEVREA